MLVRLDAEMCTFPHLHDDAFVGYLLLFSSLETDSVQFKRMRRRIALRLMQKSAHSTVAVYVKT